MTIKLLAAYGKFPWNAIITLDSITETGLIAAGTATATLAGGTAYVDPNVANPIGLTPAASAAAQALTSNRTASPLSTVKSAAFRRPLTIVQIGNSITDFGKFTLGATTAQSGFPGRSHLRYLLEQAGPSLVVGTTPAAGFIDTIGSFGAAGQSMGNFFGGIIQGMSATWFPTLDTANVVPDVVLALSLVENDIAVADVSSDAALATSYASIVAGLNLFISQAANKWPGCVIHLCGPRPDNRLSVATRAQTLAENINTYIQSLKSDRVITSDLSRVNALAPTGGNRWNIDPARCSDSVTAISGVHPNAVGALAEARVIYADLSAAVALGYAGQRLLSSNHSQGGTTSAVFGAFTGTAPAGCRILNSNSGTQTGTTGYDLTAGANTSSADQPGWTIKASVTAAPQQYIIRQAVLTIPTVPRRMRPYAIVKIISGGQNIRSLASSLQVTYSGAAYGFDFFTSGLPDRAESPVYVNGSTIVLLGAVLSPQIAAFGGAGTITNIIPDVLLDLLPSTSATIQVLESGMLHTMTPAADVWA